MEILVHDDRLLGEFGLPRTTTEHASAVDVFACAVYDRGSDGRPDWSSRRRLETGPDGEVVVVRPFETVFASLGFAMGTSERGWVGLVVPRSGKGAVDGFVLGNGTGVIDLTEYRGEVRCPVLNRNADRNISFRGGDRLAQLVILPCVIPRWTVVDRFDDTARGSGGFGSTG